MTKVFPEEAADVGVSALEVEGVKEGTGTMAEDEF